MTNPIPLERFAELDSNNVVINVEVVGQNVLVDDQGNPLSFPESEPVGQAFLISLFGPKVWKQSDTENPATYRGQVANIGNIYDPVNDVFVTPKPPTDSDVQPSQLF